MKNINFMITVAIYINDDLDYTVGVAFDWEIQDLTERLGPTKNGG